MSDSDILTVKQVKQEDSEGTNSHTESLLRKLSARQAVLLTKGPSQGRPIVPGLQSPQKKMTQLLENLKSITERNRVAKMDTTTFLHYQYSQNNYNAVKYIKDKLHGSKAYKEATVIKQEEMEADLREEVMQLRFNQGVLGR